MIVSVAKSYSIALTVWAILHRLLLSGKITFGNLKVKLGQFTFGSDRIFETLLKTAKFCSSSDTCFSKLFG